MAKNTQYTETRNLILVISFNQPAGEMGTKYQPVVIEARCEAWTPEGAVRNVSKRLDVGTVVDTPLTNKQIYTKVSAVSPQLAGVLKDAIIEALNVDPSA